MIPQCIPLLNTHMWFRVSKISTKSIQALVSTFEDIIQTVVCTTDSTALIIWEVTGRNLGRSPVMLKGRILFLTARLKNQTL